jgi:hypothetical protein
MKMLAAYAGRVMRWILCYLVWFACTACVSCGAAKQAAAVPPPTSATSRLADDFFPIMTWELPPRSGRFSDADAGLSSVAACGFTVAGFVPPAMLPECKRLGLRAIVFGGDEIRRWGKLSDEQIEASVANLVHGTERDETVLGYFICDEPGVAEFPAIAKAVTAVKRLAPGRIAYVNLFPNYATIGAPGLSQLGTASYEEYLERFITEVKPQLLSYDNYRVETSRDLQDPKGAASYFTNLMQVRIAAQRHGLPFWQIVTCNQIRPYAHPPSPANLLLQAYTTLCAGAEGMTYFTYYAGRYKTAPIDNEGRRTVNWSYLRMVNEQLRVIGPIVRRLKSTGVYFTTPADASLKTLPGETIESITSATPIMVGEFTHREHGSRYVMLVNCGLDRTTDVRIKQRGPARLITQVSPVDSSSIPVNLDDPLWLTPGQGVLLKLGDVAPTTRPATTSTSR